MDNRIDILNELKALSPLLAGMDKVNVFTVPAGYFDVLNETVLMSIKEETEGGLLGSIVGQPSIQVPKGYFESLSDNILNKIKATSIETTEVNGLSSALYSIQHKNVYTIPQGYFEFLADNILIKIKAEQLETIASNELSPMLNSIQHKNVYTIPQGYFESLTDNILSKVVTGQGNAAKELRELSQMLYSIQNENVFTVPQGYFNTLPGAILNKVKPQAAKLVTMKRRTTTILKYAVAAVFTGVMALGVYKFTNNNTTGNKTADEAVVGIGTEIAKQNKFDEELSKISDADIIKYLQVNGSDADVAIVDNTVDENELPTQEDYLTDDKALDKYLDNIDLKDFKN